MLECHAVIQILFRKNFVMSGKCFLFIMLNGKIENETLICSAISRYKKTEKAEWNAVHQYPLISYVLYCEALGNTVPWSQITTEIKDREFWYFFH